MRNLSKELAFLYLPVILVGVSLYTIGKNPQWFNQIFFYIFALYLIQGLIFILMIFYHLVKKVQPRFILHLLRGSLIVVVIAMSIIMFNGMSVSPYFLGMLVIVYCFPFYFVYNYEDPTKGKEGK